MTTAPALPTGARRPRFAPGDRVCWRYRPAGGYGYAVPVAAIVTAVLDQRVTIKIARKVRGEWCHDQKTVNAAALVPRDKLVPEVDG